MPEPPDLDRTLEELSALADRHAALVEAGPRAAAGGESTGPATVESLAEFYVTHLRGRSRSAVEAVLNAKPWNARQPPANAAAVRSLLDFLDRLMERRVGPLYNRTVQEGGHDAPPFRLRSPPFPGELAFLIPLVDDFVLTQHHRLATNRPEAVPTIFKERCVVAGERLRDYDLVGRLQEWIDLAFEQEALEEVAFGVDLFGQYSDESVGL